MASGRCLLGHPISGVEQTEVPESAPEAGAPPSFPAPRDLAPRRRARKTPPADPPADLPRSIRSAPTPERTLRPVPPPPAPDRPAEGAADAEDEAAADDAMPVVPRISRPWAPVEPDGPSGPVGDLDPWLKRPEPAATESATVPEPSPASETPAPQDAAAASRPSEVERALRQVLAERRPEPEPASGETERPVARFEPGAPDLPGRPGATPGEPKAPRSRRLRMPFSGRPGLPPPVERPAAADRPPRTLKAVPAPKPEPKPEPQSEPKSERKPKPAPPKPVRPVAEDAPKPARKPAPAAPPAASTLDEIIARRTEPARPDEPAASVASVPERAPGIAPGTRNPPPAPVSRRLMAPTPRNTVAWGLAIAATFVAGVAALVLSPSRADDTRPVVRRIALGAVPGYTVQHDPETESRLRAELGAQRAVPRQLSASTIRNPDGDIVALYQAIVFNDEVAATQRDTDDFIALFAEGAGVSADSFAERPLGERMIWSGLLDQGQAILMFRGPEVIIVITAETGADGDKLAGAILTARGV